MVKDARKYPDQRVTLADIKRISGVSRSTLYAWRTSRPQLLRVLELAVKTQRYLDSL